MALPRVYDVAKECGVDSKVALMALQDLGEYAKSGSSTLKPIVAKKLRAYLIISKQKSFVSEDDGEKSKLAEDIRNNPEFSKIYASVALSPQQAVRERIRHISVEQHPKIRQEALDNSSKRLLIVSPWAKSAVVTDHVVQQLKSLAKKDVTIDIALGIGDDLGDSHASALSRLLDVSMEYEDYVAIYQWKSHEKILISDSKYVISSFNWLSYEGPLNGYRRERGVVFDDRILVDQIYKDFKKALKNEATKLTGDFVIPKKSFYRRNK